MTTPAAAPPAPPPTSRPETLEDRRERFREEADSGLDKVGPHYPEEENEGSEL